MDTSSPSPQKKGLSPLAWVGIGCGGIVVIGVIALIIFGAVLGPKFKQFAEDAQKNPTRASAMAMIKFGAGQFEMVSEDEANKRYTVRQKTTGQLTTIYWDAQQQKPVVVPGDFSAVPGARAPAEQMKLDRALDEKRPEAPPLPPK